MHPKAFQYVQDVMLPDKLSGPSYELLAGIAARSTTSVAWSQLCGRDYEDAACVQAYGYKDGGQAPTVIHGETPRCSFRIEHPALRGPQR